MHIKKFLKILQDALQGSPKALRTFQIYLQFNELHIEQTLSHIKPILADKDKLEHPNALFLLAYMNQQGIGMKVDLTKAINLYDEAIKYNQPDALYQQALLYRYGRGCEQNYFEAIHLLERASALGHSEAMVAHGIIYLNDTPMNRESARILFQKAVNLGNTTAMRALANMYEEENKYPLAVALYNKARELGDIIAITNSVRMHLQGHTGKINYQKALSLLHLAVTSYKDAEERGFISLDGLACSKFMNQFYHENHQRAYAETITNLGYMYKEGLACKVNYTKANELFELSIQFGQSDAMYQRACMHLEGKGGPVDYKNAFSLFQKAYVLGNNESLNNLGLMYELGLSVPCDYSKAIIIYRRSKALGDKFVDVLLDRIERKMEQITIKKPVTPANSVYSFFGPEKSSLASLQEYCSQIRETYIQLEGTGFIESDQLTDLLTHS